MYWYALYTVILFSKIIELTIFIVDGTGKQSLQVHVSSLLTCILHLKIQAHMLVYVLSSLCPQFLVFCMLDFVRGLHRGFQHHQLKISLSQCESKFNVCAMTCCRLTWKYSRINAHTRLWKVPKHLRSRENQKGLSFVNIILFMKNGVF